MIQQQVRDLHHVPGWLLIAGLLIFTVQVSYHHLNLDQVRLDYEQLPEPPRVEVLKAMARGSERLSSYVYILIIQLHDNQKGENLSYRHLDYDRLQRWLKVIYQMNPQSDYPGFLATRVYSQVEDKQKIRKMIELVQELFEINPGQHWRRMTEACLLAKHQLQDLNLALEIAEKLANLPVSMNLPFWARDMRLILLDELSQHESAILLISSMLQSGVEDEDERLFLQARLLKIQQSMSRTER